MRSVASQTFVLADARCLHLTTAMVVPVADVTLVEDAMVDVMATVADTTATATDVASVMAAAIPATATTVVVVAIAAQDVLTTTRTVISATNRTRHIRMMNVFR
ncbi:protein of unknown function [Paenibacillus alvei]|uniref:Uncharacterized protein n=1 Tax=Paenibacillus alvei TaxID=44250 RepID=A0A383RDN1_PAEAL|nr:protein of unknown function [Paenibacillus alvei]